jgi:hypothetical protein
MFFRVRVSGGPESGLPVSPTPRVVTASLPSPASGLVAQPVVRGYPGSVPLYYDLFYIAKGRVETSVHMIAYVVPPSAPLASAAIAQVVAKVDRQAS